MFNPIANPRAADIAIRMPVKLPGPVPTPIASKSAHDIFACPSRSSSTDIRCSACPLGISSPWHRCTSPAIKAAAIQGPDVSKARMVGGSAIGGHVQRVAGRALNPYPLIGNMQPRQSSLGVAMKRRCQFIRLVKNANRDKSLLRKVVETRHKRRPALRTSLSSHAGCCLKRFDLRIKRYGLGRDLDKGRNRRPGPASAIMAMTIDRFGGATCYGELDMSAIAPPAQHVLRQPRGALRSLPECSGAANSQYPFSASGSKTDTPHTHLACADKRRRDRSRGR